MLTYLQRLRRLADDAYRLEQRAWRLLAHVERADTPQRVENTGARLDKLTAERDALVSLVRSLPLRHRAERTLARVGACLSRAALTHAERRQALEQREGVGR